MDGYRHQELIDETLEKDIEAALGVDPFPEFLPRIRARIANERMQEGWFWSVSWRWARVAAVVTAVAVIAVWTLRDPSRAPRDAHIMDTPPVESTTPPVEPALAAPALTASSAESPKPVSAPAVRAVRSTRTPVAVARPEVRDFSRRGCGAAATHCGDCGPAGPSDGYPAARSGIGAPSAD